MFSKFKSKIKRLYLSFRFSPIDIYVFHSVSDEYDPFRWWKCDWTQTDRFKYNILKLQEECRFISLADALMHLKNDKFRFRKYAVLTSDDGYASILDILPWLEGKNIPITLFVNPKYLDGNSWSPINEEQARFASKGAMFDMKAIVDGMYITKDQLFGLNYNNVTIGLHGYEHNDVTIMSDVEFEKNIEMSLYILKSHPRFVSFYAYTWGKFTEKTNEILKKHKIIPVKVSGGSNYLYNGIIDRKCIDGLK